MSTGRCAASPEAAQIMSATCVHWHFHVSLLASLVWFQIVSRCIVRSVFMETLIDHRQIVLHRPDRLSGRYLMVLCAFECRQYWPGPGLLLLQWCCAPLSAASAGANSVCSVVWVYPPVSAPLSAAGHFGTRKTPEGIGYPIRSVRSAVGRNLGLPPSLCRSPP